MKADKYSKIVERYDERCGKFRHSDKCGGESHFLDHANGFIGVMGGCSYLLKKKGIESEKGKQLHSFFVDSLRAIRAYLRLMENHSEYRDGELDSEEGYFPEIDSDVRNTGRNANDPTKYVFASRARLEKRVVIA